MGLPVFLTYHHYLEDAQILDRYRSGDLSHQEAAEFEAHFVDCGECRDRLTLQQLFNRPTPEPEAVAAPPEAPLAPPEKRPAEGPGAVFSLMAHLAPMTQLGILVAGTILLAVLPALLVAFQYKQVRAATEAQVHLEADAPSTHLIPYLAESVDLHFDRPTEPGIYQVSIVEIKGATMLRLPDQLGPFQSVRLPSNLLPSSSYSLHVDARRGDGSVSQYRAYRFSLDRRD